jgi:hypothetical protein
VLIVRSGYAIDQAQLLGHETLQFSVELHLKAISTIIKIFCFHPTLQIGGDANLNINLSRKKEVHYGR